MIRPAGLGFGGPRIKVAASSRTQHAFITRPMGGVRRGLGPLGFRLPIWALAPGSSDAERPAAGIKTEEAIPIPSIDVNEAAGKLPEAGEGSNASHDPPAVPAPAAKKKGLAAIPHRWRLVTMMGEHWLAWGRGTGGWSGAAAARMGSDLRCWAWRIAGRPRRAKSVAPATAAAIRHQAAGPCCES
jgi:hypothetical protein